MSEQQLEQWHEEFKLNHVKKSWNDNECLIAWEAYFAACKKREEEIEKLNNVDVAQIDLIRELEEEVVHLKKQLEDAQKDANDWKRIVEKNSEDFRDQENDFEVLAKERDQLKKQLEDKECENCTNDYKEFIDNKYRLESENLKKQLEDLEHKNKEHINYNGILYSRNTHLKSLLNQAVPWVKSGYTCTINGVNKNEQWLKETSEALK